MGGHQWRSQIQQLLRGSQKINFINRAIRGEELLSGRRTGDAKLCITVVKSSS